MFAATPPPSYQTRKESCGMQLSRLDLEEKRQTEERKTADRRIKELLKEVGSKASVRIIRGPIKDSPAEAARRFGGGRPRDWEKPAICFSGPDARRYLRRCARCAVSDAKRLTARIGHVRSIGVRVRSTQPLVNAASADPLFLHPDWCETWRWRGKCAEPTIIR